MKKIESADNKIYFIECGDGANVAQKKSVHERKLLELLAFEHRFWVISKCC